MPGVPALQAHRVWCRGWPCCCSGRSYGAGARLLPLLGALTAASPLPGRSTSQRGTGWPPSSRPCSAEVPPCWLWMKKVSAPRGRPGLARCLGARGLPGEALGRHEEDFPSLLWPSSTFPAWVRRLACHHPREKCFQVPQGFQIHLLPPCILVAVGLARQVWAGTKPALAEPLISY